MANKIHIYHNLGLGDHIICNGLVRQIALDYDEVYVTCKQHNKSQVERMFSDNPKIKGTVYTTPNPSSDYMELRPKRDDSRKFDELMYEMAGVDFRHKWDSFYVQRDLDKENELIENVYCINGDKFAFLHEDKTRGFAIYKGLPRKRTVRPMIKFGLFDYMGIIEKADEIHCIDSSFMNLIECSGIKKDNLFFHKYVRIKQNKEYGTPTLNQNWRVII